jgi:hypothetical protein
MNRAAFGILSTNSTTYNDIIRIVRIPERLPEKNATMLSIEIRFGILYHLPKSFFHNEYPCGLLPPDIYGYVG